MAGFGTTARNLSGGLKAFAAQSATNASKIKGVKDFDIAGGTAKQADLVKQQFASARQRLGGQRNEANRQITQGSERLAARTGQTGGAIEKARTQAISETAQKFGDVEADIAGKEAAAVQQVAAQGQAQELQREQFLKDLDFRKDSFGQQMALALDQFDMDRRVTAFNQVLAFEQSAIDSQKQLDQVLGGLSQLGGGGAGTFSSTKPSGGFGPDRFRQSFVGGN